MKKTLSMAAIALFMMTASCSSDDSNETVNPSTETVLLKKIVTTYEDGSTETGELSYEGNKLIKMVYGEEEYETFLYNNDGLLAERHIFAINDNHEYKHVYTYDTSNKLISFSEIFTHSIGSYNTRITFTYISNNTITAMRYISLGDAEEELYDTSIITLTNNNIASVSTETASGSSETTSSFTYDDKNNPLKNISAYEVIMLTGYRHGGGINNLISESDSIDGVLYTSEYEYNSNGYPTTMTDSEDGEQTTTQYFYE